MSLTACHAACRPRLVRWVVRASLALLEVTTLVPPPPPTSLLRRLRQLAWLAGVFVITWNNLYYLLEGTNNFTADFSTISRASFVGSTVMTAVQPVVVLLNNLCNFRRIAPPMAGLLMPPTRYHGWYVVAAAGMIGGLTCKHVRTVAHTANLTLCLSSKKKTKTK